MLDACDIYSDTFAIDATTTPALQDDPNAVWVFGEHGEDNFYGYGLIAVADCASEKVAGAVVCQRKQHSEKTSIECLIQAMGTTETDIPIGDTWYDTVGVHVFCPDWECLPICMVNSRNSKEDYDYRIKKHWLRIKR